MCIKWPVCLGRSLCSQSASSFFFFEVSAIGMVMVSFSSFWKWVVVPQALRKVGNASPYTNNKWVACSIKKFLMKTFRPTADPLPGGAGWPKFNQLEMVTAFTYKPSFLRIDVHNFELLW